MKHWSMGARSARPAGWRRQGGQFRAGDGRRQARSRHTATNYPPHSPLRKLSIAAAREPH
eukprot:CAMPEP_0181229134 /NCGR_PEP_ID=MMETSP1096-20121128/33726_1 /TAXON_ID=156174 ORGANISM="Chrysochromulina ericina, Strain CCMP281" /NCGR_SAMPLE_ID=MMETSP1096 /ASSEMBLY_ACC=CAM_ASM_000453 /LENGTH=59 /DNA_ID=CAMNT_0023322719 /DNA_START=461 /DNA_END=637 /DNA_ORIENTATION=+